LAAIVVTKVRVTLETLIAVTDVASSAGCVVARTVAANAGVSRASDYHIAAVVSDGPVKGHRRLSTKGGVESRRDVAEVGRRPTLIAGRKIEGQVHHEHREAAGTR